MHLHDVNPPSSKTKDLNTDNNREICSRSSADQNWQRSAGSYNTHKALNDGNREIGKSNRVPCHRPSLPPSVSQQMLCSTKTLSAAKEWAEICWQWRWGLEGNEKKGQKRRNKQNEKPTLSHSEFTMTTQHQGGGQRVSVCTDLSPGIGPITMETHPYPSLRLFL